MSNPFWKSKRVLVTGCNGFLGSWLTGGLVANGADVIGLIRDWVPYSNLERSGLRDQISVVNGDVCNYELVERVLAEYEIEIVFHLAAQTIVGIANRSPLSTFETNIKGTWVLLEAARRNPKLGSVVVASSDKAYGDQDQLPYHEDAPLLARHPYDVSKSCADMITQAYAHSYNMPTAVTRFGNLYGGGDLNWNRIVPGTMRSVISGESPVVRSDGTPLRDYLFVEDAVSGYMMLAENVYEDKMHGQPVNFGMDHPISALEMVKSIIEISDHPELEPIILNNANNEIADQYLASRLANEQLGWYPKHRLKDGLLKAYRWYRDFLGENS